MKKKNQGGTNQQQQRFEEYCWSCGRQGHRGENCRTKKNENNRKGNMAEAAQFDEEPAISLIAEYDRIGYEWDWQCRVNDYLHVGDGLNPWDYVEVYRQWLADHLLCETHLYIDVYEDRLELFWDDAQESEQQQLTDSDIEALMARSTISFSKQITVCGAGKPPSGAPIVDTDVSKPVCGAGTTKP